MPPFRKIIAALEIIGGVSGLVLVGTQVRAVAFSIPAFLLISAITSLYVFAIFAGIMLWRDTKVGRLSSIIIQLCQLLKIQAAQFTFAISFGFDLSPMILSNTGSTGYSIGLEMKIGGHHDLLIGNSGAPLGVGFSIVSLVFLINLLNSVHATKVAT